jgi:hypothetical protein
MMRIVNATITTRDPRVTIIEIRENESLSNDVGELAAEVVVVVVVINTSPVNQNVEYEWEGTRQVDIVMSYSVGFGSLMFILIILFVLFIRKKKE